MHCGARTPAHCTVKSVAFGDNGKYVEVLPNGIATGSQEVGGILLCLSCHDGNLTQSNMMQNWSYEQQIGLLTNTTYGSQKIPTLLGNDGTTAGNYTNDHPVGQNATISSGNGLVFANNAFTVTSGSAYAQLHQRTMAGPHWRLESGRTLMASMARASLMCFAPPATTST